MALISVQALEFRGATYHLGLLNSLFQLVKGHRVDFKSIGTHPVL